eukprot:335443-Chlamydomonas_euryale.AAC.1
MSMRLPAVWCGLAAAQCASASLPRRTCCRCARVCACARVWLPHTCVFVCVCLCKSTRSSYKTGGWAYGCGCGCGRGCGGGGMGVGVRVRVWVWVWVYLSRRGEAWSQAECRGVRFRSLRFADLPVAELKGAVLPLQPTPSPPLPPPSLPAFIAPFLFLLLPCAQACFADLPDAGLKGAVVLLQRSQLTTLTACGLVHESPLAVPGGVARTWPCPAGVLLEGPHGGGTALLAHPLEPPLPVLADVSLRAGQPGGFAGWSGERVVWAGREAPYAATFSDAGRRLAVWRIGRIALPPGAVGNLPDLPAATPYHHTPLAGSGHAAGLSPPLPPVWSPAVADVAGLSHTISRRVSGTAVAERCAPRSGGGVRPADSSTPMSMATTHSGGGGGAAGASARAPASPAPSAWPSSIRRVVARGADGRLSPSMFNAAPRGGMLPTTDGMWGGGSRSHSGAAVAHLGGCPPSAYPTAAGGSGGRGGGGGGGSHGAELPLLPPPAALVGGGGGGGVPTSVVFELVHEEAMATAPSSAVLATDADGELLLCLLCYQSQTLTALRLPAAGDGGGAPAGP